MLFPIVSARAPLPDGQSPCVVSSRKGSGLRHGIHRWLHLFAVAIVIMTISVGCQQESAGLGPGVTYRRISDPRGPFSIHVLEIRRGQRDLYLSASVGMAIKGKETVPEMVAAMPPQEGIPLAAVNGGYFEFTKQPLFFGVPAGLSIIQGELVHGPKTTALCINARGQPSIQRVTDRFSVTWPDGSTAPFGLNCPPSDYDSQVRTASLVLFTPRFGPSTGTANVRELVLGPAEPGPWLPLRPGQRYRARVTDVRTAGNTEIAPDTLVLSIARNADTSAPSVRVGDVLVLDTSFTQDMTDVVTAVSGEPQLLTTGQAPPVPPDTTDGRAPRTLVGFNDTHIFLVVVDGRQPELSVGMNFGEAAMFMHQLGCTEALNLDGSGSSTFWLAGQVMNSPADGQPRAVGDCLVLMRRPRQGTER